MPLATSITFGTLVLDGSSGGNYIEPMTATRVAGSLKQRLNQNVTIQEIPGRAKEWQIEITGLLSGNNREADLDTLEGYNDGSVRQFVDGDHDGNYIIVPGTLVVNRSSAETTIIRYSMTIRQYTQTLPS